MPPERIAQTWQLFPEMRVAFSDCLASRKLLALGGGTQPVADLDNGLPRLSVMRVNILTRDVGDKVAVAKFFNIEDETAFPALRRRPEALASQKEPKLQRHIEVRQAGIGVNAYRGNIMDAVARLLDQLKNLFLPRLACVVDGESATGDEPQIVNGEDDRFESWLVGRVKRAIDENVARPELTHGSSGFEALS